MRQEYDLTKGRRDAIVRTPPGQSHVALQLDNDLLGWFRARAHASGGGNYQTLINAALREYVTRHGAEQAAEPSAKDDRALLHEPDFRAHLLGGPKVDDLQIERDRDTGREIPWLDDSE